MIMSMTTTAIPHARRARQWSAVQSAHRMDEDESGVVAWGMGRACHHHRRARAPLARSRRGGPQRPPISAPFRRRPFHREHPRQTFSPQVGSENPGHAFLGKRGRGLGCNWALRVGLMPQSADWMLAGAGSLGGDSEALCGSQGGGGKGGDVHCAGVAKAAPQVGTEDLEFGVFVVACTAFEGRLSLILVEQSKVGSMDWRILQLDLEAEG